MSGPAPGPLGKVPSCRPAQWLCYTQREGKSAGHLAFLGPWASLSCPGHFPCLPAKGLTGQDPGDLRPLGEASGGNGMASPPLPLRIPGKPLIFRSPLPVSCSHADELSGLQDGQGHGVRGVFTTTVWEQHFQKALQPKSAPETPNAAPGTVPVLPPGPSAPWIVNDGHDLLLTMFFQHEG